MTWLSLFRHRSSLLRTGPAGRVRARAVRPGDRSSSRVGQARGGTKQIRPTTPLSRRNEANSATVPPRRRNKANPASSAHRRRNEANLGRFGLAAERSHGGLARRGGSLRARGHRSTLVALADLAFDPGRFRGPHAARGMSPWWIRNDFRNQGRSNPPAARVSDSRCAWPLAGVRLEGPAPGRLWSRRLTSPSMPWTPPSWIAHRWN